MHMQTHGLTQMFMMGSYGMGKTWKNDAALPRQACKTLDRQMLNGQAVVNENQTIDEPVDVGSHSGQGLSHSVCSRCALPFGSPGRWIEGTVVFCQKARRARNCDTRSGRWCCKSFDSRGSSTTL